MSSLRRVPRSSRPSLVVTLTGTLTGALRRRPRGDAETSDVGNKLPHLFVGQPRKRRHLRTGHAGANRMKEIAVLVAVDESWSVQGWTAIALPRRAVARLTGLVVQRETCRHRGGTVRQWISGGVRRLSKR